MFNWPMMMLVDIRITFSSFFQTLSKKFGIFKKFPYILLEFNSGYTAKLATIFLCKKTFLHKTAYTWVNNEDMNTASPTIEKESFFKCNHIRKKIFSSIFISGFGLLCFEIAGLWPAIAWPSDSQEQIPNFFESVWKKWWESYSNVYQHHHGSIKYQGLRIW